MRYDKGQGTGDRECNEKFYYPYPLGNRPVLRAFKRRGMKRAGKYFNRNGQCSHTHLWTQQLARRDSLGDEDKWK